jgi:phosphoglycerate dehydrogenase-like enzyme
MKAVLQYRATPGFTGQLLGEAPDWLEVVIVDEDDKARFAREMLDAEVLLHVLEPVTDAVIAGAPRLALIQKIGIGSTPSTSTPPGPMVWASRTCPARTPRPSPRPR